MKGKVLKYYSVTSGCLEDCLARLQKVQEKHPDRDYVLLKNMRGYYSDKVTLAQRVEVEIDLPTEEELKLPPPCPKPPGHYPYGKDILTLPDWNDYERDQSRRKKYIGEAQKPARDLVKAPLNF